MNSAEKEERIGKVETALMHASDHYGRKNLRELAEYIVELEDRVKQLESVSAKLKGESK